MPTGLLLLNLGTPDAPTTSAVRRYLAEFLSDPYVLDINPIGRWLANARSRRATVATQLDALAAQHRSLIDG